MIELFSIFTPIYCSLLLLCDSRLCLFFKYWVAILSSVGRKKKYNLALWTILSEDTKYEALHGNPCSSGFFPNTSCVIAPSWSASRSRLWPRTLAYCWKVIGRGGQLATAPWESLAVRRARVELGRERASWTHRELFLYINWRDERDVTAEEKSVKGVEW